jgi:signal transduction histidine kinase
LSLLCTRTWTLERPGKEIVGRRTDSSSSLRVILRPGRQTQVGGGIVVAIDARGDIASYVGTMRLGPVLHRHAVDAFVVLLATLWQAWIWVEGATFTAVAAAFLGTLPLLWRRRFPFAAPALVFAGLAGLSLADPGAAAEGEFLHPLSALSLALAFWLAGGHEKEEQAIAGTAIGLASVVAVGRSAGHEFVVTQADSDLGIVGLLLLAGGLSSAAFALRRRTQGAVQLEKRAAWLEREREERARAAVAAERVRIAGDLHDVIAHSVSVMTVQAGAARLLLGEDPQRAREPLLSVEETGRQALADMRRLLGLLRTDEGSVGPRAVVAGIDAEGTAGADGEVTGELVSSDRGRG